MDGLMFAKKLFFLFCLYNKYNMSLYLGNKRASKFSQRKEDPTELC